MVELFSNLGIDAKILAAQIINFAVLLLLLQKFAYKPIITMLEKRRREVERANQYAEEIEKRIQSIETTKNDALAEARKESSALIKRAEEDAKRTSERIVTEAGAQAKQLVARGEKQIQEQHERLRQELKRELGATIAIALESTVGDILDKNSKDKLLSQAIEKAKRS